MYDIGGGNGTQYFRGAALEELRLEHADTGQQTCHFDYF